MASCGLASTEEERRVKNAPKLTFVAAGEVADWNRCWFRTASRKYRVPEPGTLITKLKLHTRRFGKVCQNFETIAGPGYHRTFPLDNAGHLAKFRAMPFPPLYITSPRGQCAVMLLAAPHEMRLVKELGVLTKLEIIGFISNTEPRWRTPGLVGIKRTC